MLQFGIGAMYGNPNAGNQGTPSGPQQFGILQDVSLEMNQQLVELRGQNKFPDDVAPGNMDLKGKAAFAKIQIDVYNALFFGNTVNTGISIIVNGEAANIPGSGPYTITVTNNATFQADLGVVFTSNGKPLVLTSGTPSTGQYAVNSSTGVYTFAAADTGLAVRISYAYTSATGRTMNVTNQLMGYGPVSELWLSLPYQGTNGMRLYAIRSSKMSSPMKRDGYVIADFEFTCYANATGKVFDFFQVSA